MSEVAVKTQEQMMDELRKALDTQDFRQVQKISGDIAKAQASAEKALREASQKQLADVTEKVKGVLDKVITKLEGEIDPELLKVMDGVWYARDFGENITSCRLIKSAAKAKTGGGGGGGGKKFSITTNELLAQHGDLLWGDSGKTFNQLYEEAGTDGNKRYQVRMKLLHVAGLS